MTEETREVEAEDVKETESTTEVELSAEEIQAIVAERDRLKAKHQEAEKHRKEAEKKAAQIERERAEAERKKAEEEGNHQKLWETERERAERLEAELAARDEQLAERDKREVEFKRDTETRNLVSELTTDAKRQNALNKLVKDHVQIVDGEKQYQVDGVTIDKDRLVKYIREEYPSLVDGSGMTGGGATGANRGGASQVKPNMSGSREERKAAIAAKFNL